MRKVVVTATARAELRSIVSYLSVFGRATARSFVREFDSRIETLQEGAIEFPAARHPKLAAAGYHVALVKNYLLLYRVNRDGSIGVAHVFHQSQDYARYVTEI